MNNNYTIAIYGIQDVNHTAIPTLSHDHSIAVMQNGGITFFGQLERLNRKKHSNAMPAMVLDLLKEKKLINNRAEIIFIDNILGRSFINKQGNIRFEGPLAKKLRNSYETGKLWWFDQTKPAFVLNHELAHIGSCLPFYGSFRDNSLWVHYDGGASLSNFSAWHFKNKKIIL